MTHNDVHPGNVIFRAGAPVAIIDFDLAAPGSPAWDLAVTACGWAPLRADADVTDERSARRLARVAVLLDGYGADAQLRTDTAAACAEASDWIAAVIRDAAARGHPAFGRLWHAQADTYDRAATWIAAHRAALGDAVRGTSW